MGCDQHLLSGSVQESALEGTSYIEESAMQLFLESDPSSREPKERYYTNYEIIARDELSSALERLEELQNRMGAPLKHFK